MAEEYLDQPGRAGPSRCRAGRLEGGGRRLGGIEGLDDDVGDAARGRLVAIEPHDVCGAVRRETFEHVGRLARRSRPG